MIELLLVAAVSCAPAPEPPLPDIGTRLALHVYREAGMIVTVPPDHPLVPLFGTIQPELPVAPTDSPDDISYGVWVDPIYKYECFSDFVNSTLSNDRSWPNLRRAGMGETPQFWVTLVPPAKACGSYSNHRASCTWNNGDGTGVITINALRWNRGHGYGLEKDQARLVNHEVGHILGFGHYDCSLMGSAPWTPTAGYPSWDTEWDSCDPIVWPSDMERLASTTVYARRWMWNMEGVWDGPEFVTEHLTSSS